MTRAPEELRRPRLPPGFSPLIRSRGRKFFGVSRLPSPFRAVLPRLPPFLFLPIRYSILPVSTVDLQIRAARVPHLQFL